MSEEEKAARERQKQRVRIVKRKRLGRFGETFYDRALVSGFVHYPHEPDWTNLTPAVLPQTKSLVEISQDQMFRPIQEQNFGGIYVSSDNDETLDDLDKKYKFLGSGFKNYTKQKKKLGTERTPGSQQST